jgi:putative PIG3 family NAD(P)H quinone oxidoreductase
MRALIHPMPGTVELATRPDPAPAADELVVEVHASGLNRADLLQRDGRYPAPPGWPAEIPGLEYAGVVLETGATVTGWSAGDRVMGLAGGGAHASRLVVPADIVLRVPDAVDLIAAAAIPEAFMTAWDALVLRGRASRGERVLIHAAGSGVGTAAVQLARMWGLTSIGTSRTPAKLERAGALGLSHGVVSTNADWPDRVGGPVDVIIDTLGAGVFEQNLSLLAHRGRLVLVGTLTGGVAPHFDLTGTMRRRLEVVGTMMRSRGHEERSEQAARFAAEVLPGFATGALQPVVERAVPVAEHRAAYQQLAENRTFGKLVLMWNESR